MSFGANLSPEAQRAVEDLYRLIREAQATLDDIIGSDSVVQHSALVGLSADDHEQYALADGSRGNFETAGAAATAEANAENYAFGIVEAERLLREAADTSLEADVDAESTARIAADAALQSGLDAESATRASADSVLGAEIDQVEADLAQEVADRVAGDAATLASAEAHANTEDDAHSVADRAYTDAEVAAEAAVRAAADAVLDGRVDDEEAARIAADNALGVRIDDEEAVRAAADLVLQGNIDAEETSRIAADANLQGQINNHLSDAIAAHAASAISYAPDSNPLLSWLNATNVQAAITQVGAQWYAPDAAAVDALIDGLNTLATGEITNGDVFAEDLIVTRHLAAGSVTAAVADVASLRTAILVADSVTASMIDVTDLQAIGATIGGFEITANAMYAGVGTFGNANTPVYLGTNANQNFSLGDKMVFSNGQLALDGSVTIGSTAASDLASQANVAAANAAAAAAQADATQALTDAATADGKAVTAQTAASAAQSTADSKADPSYVDSQAAAAQAAAEAAAAADAQTKADAAQSAATAAAAADATAKANAAEAAAEAAAALDALNKANAAQAAAEATAAADATSKADAAQQAAETYAAAQAASEAAAAQAAATAVAAADATSKANAAQAAATAVANAAQSAADAAQASANTKQKAIAYQAGAPSSPAVGDLWVETDQGNRLRRWNGSTWITIQDSTAASTAASLAQSAANAAQADATSALSDASTAQGTANSAVSAAATAQSAASAAQSTANNAVSVGNAAQAAADAAQSTADDAWTTGDEDTIVDAINAAPGTVTIDGGKLTAESVSATQIAAGTITSAQVNAASLRSAIITAGSIVAGDLTAGAVTAGDIAANAVTASTIAANAVVAGKIATNAVTAGTIAAGSITADKIATSARGANLLPNGNFSDDPLADPNGYWYYGANAYNAEYRSGDAAIGANYVRIPAAYPSGAIYIGPAASVVAHAIPVEPGKTYRISAKLRHSNGNGTYYVYGRWFDANGVYGGGLSFSGVSNVSNATLDPVNWTEVSSIWTPGASMRYVLIQIYNHGSSTGTLDVDDVRVEPMVTGVEIKDDTITAANIAAGAVTTDKLAAGAVEADKISVSTLSALTADLGTVTAGTIDGVSISSDTFTLTDGTDNVMTWGQHGIDLGAGFDYTVDGLGVADTSEFVGLFVKDGDTAGLFAEAVSRNSVVQASDSEVTLAIIEHGFGSFESSVRVLPGGTYVDGDTFRATTDFGYVELGAFDAGSAHFNTDRGQFLFNADVTSGTGNFKSNTTDINFHRAGVHKLQFTTDTTNFFSNRVALGGPNQGLNNRAWNYSGLRVDSFDTSGDDNTNSLVQMTFWNKRYSAAPIWGTYGPGGEHLRASNNPNTAHIPITASAFNVASTYRVKEDLEWVEDAKAITAAKEFMLTRFRQKVRPQTQRPSKRFVDLDERWRKKGRSPLDPQPHHFESHDHDCSVDTCGGTADNPCMIALNDHESFGGLAEWQQIVAPETVRVDEGGQAAELDIGQLAALGLGAAGALARQVERLEARVRALEAA